MGVAALGLWGCLDFSPRRPDAGVVDAAGPRDADPADTDAEDAAQPADDARAPELDAAAAQDDADAGQSDAEAGAQIPSDPAFPSDGLVLWLRAGRSKNA